MPVTFPAYPVRNAQRGRTYAVLKSLVNSSDGLPATGSLPGQSESSGQIVINFPCMPDSIELARRASYRNLLHTPVAPDGMHFYDYTEPMTIPLSFTLNGYDDDYCGAHGPLMLLSIAAKLHALMMPIIPRGSDLVRSGLASPPTEQPVANGATQAEVQQAADANSRSRADFEQQTFVRNGKLEYIPAFSRFAFPPACSLNVMMAQIGGSEGQSNVSNDGVRSLGINCTGFLQDVRVLFKGPWLQGSFREDGLRNLPSEAEFSFTFVHQPGYTNNVLAGGSPVVVTTASDIYQRLYNTADLAGSGGRLLYAGFDGSGIPASDGPGP